jgi:hypothetical protein
MSILRATICVFALLFASHATRASMIGDGSTSTLLYADSTLVIGGGAYVDAISVPTAGDLLLNLTDLLPTVDPFASLEYQLSNGPTSLTPLTAAGNILSYQVSGPMTLYVDLFASTGSTGLGLFNFDATLVTETATVPLPSAGPMLLLVLPFALWLSGLAPLRAFGMMTPGAAASTEDAIAR